MIDPKTPELQQHGSIEVPILNKVLSEKLTLDKSLDKQLADVEGLITKRKQLSEGRETPESAPRSNRRFSSSASTSAIGLRHSGSTKAMCDGRVRRRHTTTSTSSSDLVRIGTFELKMDKDGVGVEDARGRGAHQDRL